MPHLLLLPQMLRMHWLASLQLAPLVLAQVLVVGLQPALVHTACALGWVQRPSCKPSLGMAVPALSFGAHVRLERSQ